MSARDSQRLRVYKSEWSVNWGSPRYATVDEAQAYVDGLTRSAWFQARWGRRRIEVRFVNGQGGRGGGSVIRLGVWARQQHVVLHELAHCLAPLASLHNAEFCATFLLLVRHEMGDDLHRALKAAYVERRVKHRARVVEVRPERVRTRASVLAANRAARSKPVTASERTAAAAVLRRAVRNGEFGPTGRKPRAAALAVARQLEGAG